MQVVKLVRETLDIWELHLEALSNQIRYKKLLTERGALQKLQLNSFEVKRFQDRVLRIEQNFERVMRRNGREQ